MPTLNLLAVAVLPDGLSIVPAATHASASLLLLMSFVELSVLLQPLLWACRSSWASAATSGSTLTLTPTFSHALAMASVTLSSTAGTKHCSGSFAGAKGARGCCAHHMHLLLFEKLSDMHFLIHSIYAFFLAYEGALQVCTTGFEEGVDGWGGLKTCCSSKTRSCSLFP